MKKWSFLRGMVEDAKRSAPTKAFVLAKDFNIKQNSAAAWLTEDVIRNEEVFDAEELRGQYFFGGIDLSETTDLTAAVALFINPYTLKKYAISRYFVSEAKADAILTDKQDKLNPEKKNYREWAAKGYVTICEGNEVDTSLVSQWFWELMEKYSVTPLFFGYDQWHSGCFRSDITKMFGASTLERITMSFGALSNAMSTLESDLTFKKLNYGNNPVTSWNLHNVAVKLNSYGEMLPVKEYGNSQKRIDGVMALLIAYATFSKHRKDYLEYQEAVVRR